MNKSIWKFLSSLKLTVVCLALGIVLVFIGTVAQADEGLYQAQARYFKQWFVIGPMLFGHRMPIALPGGYLLGSVLVINLLAAHIQRFQWSMRKFGIHLTHLGIVVLLLGQLATDMLSEETHLSLREGESRNFTEGHRSNELVFATDSEDPKVERVVSMPESAIASRKELSDANLPFSVRVKSYQVNSAVLERSKVLEAAGQLSGAFATVEGQYATDETLVAQAESAQQTQGRLAVWKNALQAIGDSEPTDFLGRIKEIAAQPELAGKLRAELKTRFRTQMLAAFESRGGETALAAQRIGRKESVTAESLPPGATEGFGKQYTAVALPEGKTMDSSNQPYATLELLEAGKSLGTWLVSPYLNAQQIQAGGKTWRVALRAHRVYYPFSIKLLKTTHEVYRGTDIPKNFQSRIRIENPSRSETREVDISMNNPLRYQGLTYFQYQMGKDERASVGTSTLQVIRNPSWLTPYLGCILVGVGMTYQFLFHLVGFITKRQGAANAA